MEGSWKGDDSGKEKFEFIKMSHKLSVWCGPEKGNIIKYIRRIGRRLRNINKVLEENYHE